MDLVEQLEIQLNTDQLFWLNICLGFLMFGVALDIKVNDFKSIFKQPFPVLIGLTSQWLVLPLLTYLLVVLWEPHPGIGLGMMLVAACPGGNMSNFLVHLANGNRALSVSMTSITTVTSFVATPLILIFWGSLYGPTASILKSFTLSPFSLLWVLTQLVLIPLTLGMLCNTYLPTFTKALKGYIKCFSILVFLGILIGALLANSDNITKYLKFVFVLVLIHNGMAYLAGYLIAKLAKLSDVNVRTIMIETAIQNSGLGLIIVFNFYGGMSSMALVAAWWGIWHLVSGFSLAIWWSKRGIQALPQ